VAGASPGAALPRALRCPASPLPNIAAVALRSLEIVVNDGVMPFDQGCLESWPSSDALVRHRVLRRAVPRAEVSLLPFLRVQRQSLTAG
jgi:hypothetical protein